MNFKQTVDFIKCIGRFFEKMNTPCYTCRYYYKETVEKSQ